MEGGRGCAFALRSPGPPTCTLVSLCVHSPPKAAAGGEGPGGRRAQGPAARERRGTGPERNSPAAQECQASRSPVAARLLAPARSQEQPGARSPGSGNASRPAPPRPSSAGSQKLACDFLCLADPGPRSRRFPTGLFRLLPATGPLQTPKGCPLPFPSHHPSPPSQRHKSWAPHPTQPVEPGLCPAAPDVFPHIPCRSLLEEEGGAVRQISLLKLFRHLSSPPTSPATHGGLPGGFLDSCLKATLTRTPDTPHSPSRHTLQVSLQYKADPYGRSSISNCLRLF